MTVHEIMDTPDTTSYEKVICGKYGVSKVKVARVLGLNYPHVVNMLNGNAPIPAYVRHSLDKIINQLQKSERRIEE